MLLDADGSQVQFFEHKNIQLHEGFFKGYKKMRTAVLAAVRKIRKVHKGARLVVSGHSLGGALATVAAADLVLNQGVDNIELVTFGSPRVFDKKGAEIVQDSKLEGNIYRVVNKNDPVPHMPLCDKDNKDAKGFSGFLHDAAATVSGWFTDDKSFWHVAREVWISKGCSDYAECDDVSAYKVCDASGEDPTCSDSVNAEDYDVDDHVNGYCGVQAEGILDDKRKCPKKEEEAPAEMLDTQCGASGGCG